MPVRILRGYNQTPIIQFWENERLIEEVNDWEAAFRFLAKYFGVKVEELL